MMAINPPKQKHPTRHSSMVLMLLRQHKCSSLFKPARKKRSIEGSFHTIASRFSSYLEKNSRLQKSSLEQFKCDVPTGLLDTVRYLSSHDREAKQQEGGLFRLLTDEERELLEEQRRLTHLTVRTSVTKLARAAP